MPSRPRALLAVAVLAAALPVILITSLSRRCRPESEPIIYELLPPTAAWKEA